MLFSEASAKAGQGVEDAFLALVKAIFDQRVKNGTVPTGQTAAPKIDLTDTQAVKTKGGCCG